MEMNKRACAVCIKEEHAVSIQMLPPFQIFSLNLNSWVLWATQLLAAASLQLLMTQVAMRVRLNNPSVSQLLL